MSSVQLVTCELKLICKLHSSGIQGDEFILFIDLYLSILKATWHAVTEGTSEFVINQPSSTLLALSGAGIMTQ